MHAHHYSGNFHRKEVLKCGANIAVTQSRGWGKSSYLFTS